MSTQRVWDKSPCRQRTTSSDRHPLRVLSAYSVYSAVKRPTAFPGHEEEKDYDD